MPAHFEIQTPAAVQNINFAALAEAYGPVHYVADQEGTHAPYAWRASRAVLGEEGMDAIRDAIHGGYLLGAHAMTNRAGKGGLATTTRFVDAIHAIDPNLPSLGESPLAFWTRNQRKPSGYMGADLLLRLAGLGGPKKFAVGFAGDKRSDMDEARVMSMSRGALTVVGFMVERLGETDHVLDTLAGKRKKADAYRAEVARTAAKTFVLT